MCFKQSCRPPVVSEVGCYYCYCSRPLVNRYLTLPCLAFLYCSLHAETDEVAISALRAEESRHVNDTPYNMACFLIEFFVQDIAYSSSE